MKKTQFAPDANLTAAVLPHDAYWSIEPAAGRRLWQLLQTESVAAHLAAVEARGRSESEPDDKPYEMQGSTAILYLSGPMTKSPTSMSMGTSTVRMRRMVRLAAADPDVKKIAIRIDSPGGAVSGTGDLAGDVRAAAAKKPVVAYVEDCCCSAAYWVASQCSAIYCNATAMVGSTGTIMVIDDSSRAAQNAGVEVLVFGSGAYKGAGVDGAPVTPEQRAYFQGIVDSLNSHFLAAVKAGRSLSDEQLVALTDARVHVGEAAVGMGLVDGICSLDDVLAGKVKAGSAKPAAKSGYTGPKVFAAMEERRKMRNPIAAWNAFRAGMAAAGADISEEGGDDETTSASALAPVFIGAPTPVHPAKVDLSQNAEYLALKAQNDALSGQLTALTTQLGGLTTAMASQTAAAQFTADCSRVEALVRVFKMTPAEAVGWKKLAQENPAAFAASFATQESRPVLAQIKGDVVKAKMLDAGNPGAQLAALAKARSKADKISMAEAAGLVAAENPELARAHKDSVSTLSTVSTEGAN